MPKFQFLILRPNIFRWFWTITLIAAGAWFANAGGAADKPKSDQTGNEPIQIVANELISYNEDKYAEFTGNVKVTQGNFSITSDKLKIYYQGELLDNEKKGGDEELLKKIIATGN
ncbi:MAG: LptA/OstA family protein, partial [Desulfobacterales bacterium]